MMRQELKEALWVYGFVMGVFTILSLLGRVVPLIGAYLHIVIAALFLYVPTWFLTQKGRDLDAYGLNFRPVAKNLRFLLIAMLIVFPPYAFTVYYYYKFACERFSPQPKLLGNFCFFRRNFSSWGELLGAFRWPPQFGQSVLAQIIAVGLPEEYFFRGYIQTQLNQVWPARRKLFGIPFGKAIVVTSLMFAVGHLVTGFNPGRLAVFFPSLLFGLLREGTGSIGASTLFHAACNLLNQVLHRWFFR